MASPIHNVREIYDIQDQLIEQFNYGVKEVIYKKGYETVCCTLKTTSEGKKVGVVTNHYPGRTELENMVHQAMISSRVCDTVLENGYEIQIAIVR